MEFKIDTKPTYAVIIPVYDTLNANLTAALRQKWNALTESGSKNIIVDLQHCTNGEEAAIEELVALHEEMYGAHQSLVFTSLQNPVLSLLKKNETDLLINIAPTLQEAVDIISMEILERELFDEEF